jgi:PAS domain S-box-containing protein
MTARRVFDADDSIDVVLRRHVSWVLVAIGALLVLGNGAYLTYERNKRDELQRAADMSALRTELIVVSAPVALVMCDETETISLCNPAARDMFGYQPGELIGQPVAILIPPDLREAHQQAFDAAVARLRKVNENWLYQRTDMPTEGLTKTGERIPLLLSIRMIKYDGKIEFVTSMRAPTPRPAVNSIPLPVLPRGEVTQQRR